MVCILAAATWWGSMGSARGHAVLMNHLGHHVRLEVGTNNIDVTLTLTFHEVPSLAERRWMDADRDGRIAADETRSYLDECVPRFEHGLSLMVDDRPVTLIPLHPPSLELPDDGLAPMAHHVLTLRYFARTPPGLRPGSRLSFGNRLWQPVPALRSFECVGLDGIRLEPELPAPSERASEVNHARCLKVPEVRSRAGGGAG